MDEYSDSELEFIRREITKRYESQALKADDVVIEIPQYPKSVGDEKFNFLSGYVEKTLSEISGNSKFRIQELEEFNKLNSRNNFPLSATLKKLFCEQHYKRSIAQRKTAQFKLMSINRFYYYFSGKNRKDYWNEIGASEMNKRLGEIQKEIDAFYAKESKTEKDDVKAADTGNNLLSNTSSDKKQPEKLYYKFGILGLSLFILLALVYYFISLRPLLENNKEMLSYYQKKIIRTPALARNVPGLIGSWYSYNRTRECNEENLRIGNIFGRIEWKIDSDRNGNLVFARPTNINENDGWVEVMNMQINFFMNVHPKFEEKNAEENFGFRHFICNPNKVEISKADTLWCVCTSYIHKDGRLDEPLASREILIRKKPGQIYPTDFMTLDSIPEGIKSLLPKDKSYLRLKP